MKSITSFVTATSVALFLFSCQKMQEPSMTQSQQQPAEETLSGSGTELRKGIAGYVYTLSNQTSGNSVRVYSHTADGKINYITSYPTGGNGTGAGLGSEGAVTLSEDNHVLLAVNAGSNSITSFKVSNDNLEWKSTVASGGLMPISVTVDHDLVYVLNAGGSGNISGFRLEGNGTLHSLANSTKPLSTSSAGPAQVSFVADGKALAVTEKANNRIITYTINGQGLPGAMHWTPSANATPFGFAVGKEGYIFVSEAGGGVANASSVSSYYIANNGEIHLMDGPVKAGQSAACWVVVTNNEKYVYSTNAGSGNVSSFNGKHGDLSVLQAIAGITGTGSSPTDAALSENSKFLYVLNTGGTTIKAFSVDNDGGLNAIQTITGLPGGDVGLASK